MRFNFEWDPSKAKQNMQKHNLAFERSAEVFLDPLAISIYDEKHSAEEDRWITVGKDRANNVLVAVYTFLEADNNNCRIRIISTRKATKKEINSLKVTRYEERI